MGGSARECGADMLVLDAELSPSQTRNLEEATGLPICDLGAAGRGKFGARARRPRLASAGDNKLGSARLVYDSASTERSVEYVLRACKPCERSGVLSPGLRPEKLTHGRIT